MRLTLSVSHILQKKNGSIQHPNRLLLYKHDDDVRQEMLAIQFIETCDRILKSSGLDLKIKTFRCMPVAEKRGFIEWVPGTVSMSEISKPVGSLLTDPNHRPGSSGVSDEGNYNSTTNSGAFLRLGDWCKYESLRALRKIPASRDKIGLSGDNPVQEFLRASSFEKTAPYLIRKEVMDTYIKSCAGYSVITYLLGVGDRHTDNLLLHPDGYFLHCDYSFLFGQDPKTYFPMRVTSQMINGMGGVDSDNFAKFLSLVGAAFTALREHTSVRTLLSMVRILSTTDLPSLSIGQTPDEALRNMLQRFRLDLSKDEAVEYIEGVIHHSMNSKLWLAVDVMHDIGKRL
jgi:phosphatidylinositol 3-kinase